MINKSDRMELQEAITAAITVLCKNRLGHLRSDFSVEGLLGISLNEEQTFLISIKKEARVSVNQVQENKYAESSSEKSNIYKAGPKKAAASTIKGVGGQNIGASETLNKVAPGAALLGSSRVQHDCPPVSDSSQLQTNLAVEQKKISSSENVSSGKSKTAASARKSEKDPRPRPADRRRSSGQIVKGTSVGNQKRASKRTSLGLNDVPLGQNKKMHLTSPESTSEELVPLVAGPSTRSTLNVSANDAAQLLEIVRGKAKCLVCDGVFKTKTTCLRHIRYKHLHIGTRCEICGRTFRHTSEVRTHRTILVTDGVGGYPCDLCNVVFKTSCGQQEHSRTHSTDDKLFHCYLCAEVFESYWHCNQHLHKTHPPCAQCGINIDPAGLEAHRERYHSEMTTDMIDIIDIESDAEFDDVEPNSVDFRASVVNMSDSVTDTLGATKESSHTNPNPVHQDRPQEDSDQKSLTGQFHVCEVCQSAFTLAREYERHLLVHPWCEICGARFRSWSLHMKVCVSNRSSDDEDQKDEGGQD